MLPELLALVVIVFLAAFAQGVMGFGSGTLCMALLPLSYQLLDVGRETIDAVAVVSVICLVINATVLSQVWRAISWRPLVPLVLGAASGVPVGVYILKRMNEGQLQIALGSIMLLYTVVKISPLRLLSRTIGDSWGLPFGAAGGALGAASNVGGPPLIIYLTMKDWGKDQTKATLQAYFLTISVIQVPFLIATDVLHADHALPIAAGLLPLFVGVWGGSRLYARMGTGLFTQLMVWALGVIGIFYVVRGLSAGV